MRLNSISPTQLATLRQCHYRVALDLAASGSSSRDNVAAALGRCVHRVLQDLVEADTIRSPGPLDVECSEAWARAIAEVYGEPPSPSMLPGYYLKAARLPTAAARLRTLLEPYPRLETELPLASHDGRICGIADLVATGPRGVLIVDYKSGIERDAATGRPMVDDYARQLQLYAYLISEMRGVWPAEATILPLDGDVIEVDVSEDVCRSVVGDALERMEEFNVETDPRPASPSPSSCRYCPHMLRCKPFKDACDEGWAPELLAVIGSVIKAEQSANGTVSVEMIPEAGSVGHGPVSLTRLSVASYPDLVAAAPGDEASASGLYPIGAAGDVFGLRDSGRLNIAPSAR